MTEPLGRYQRGDVSIEAHQGREQVLFQLDDGVGGVSELTADELYWLCVVSGPALLHHHVPARSPAQLLAERHPRPA